MAKVTLDSITTSYAGQAALEDWRTALEAAIENTLSRDGTTPNTMDADLDMNSYNINNIGQLSVSSLEVAGENLVPATKVPDWEGAWVTSTAYAVDDLVRQNGNVYICLEAHTSGTFATDLAATKWELFVSKGDSGGGSGDLVSTNDLSDLNDADTALSNLGGGITGIALFKDSTAAAARTELGLGDSATLNISGADSTVISGTAGTDGNLAQWNSDGDVVDGPDVLDEDTMSSDSASAVPTQQSVKAYVDTSVSAVGSPDFISTTTLSSDESEITITGLSGYKYIEFTVAGTSLGSGTVALGVRTSGGTWRTLASLTDVPLTNDGFVGVGHIKNFNGSESGFPSGVFMAASKDAGSELNRSGSENQSKTTPQFGTFYATWSETWDEIRITGSFEGSTADNATSLDVWGY